MKVHKFSGFAKFTGEKFDVTLETTIFSSNCLYISVGKQSNLCKKTILINPFTPQMLNIYGRGIDKNFKYDFSGNNVGQISDSNSGKEGVIDFWPLKSINMEFNYYKDRVHLSFVGKTNYGSSTLYGLLDNKTENTLPPYDFEINFFIPIDDFSLFLEIEPDKIDEVENRKKFIEALKDSAPIYQND